MRLLEASRLVGRGWEPGNCRDRAELHKAYEERRVLQARPPSTVRAVALPGPLIGKDTSSVSASGQQGPACTGPNPM